MSGYVKYGAGAMLLGFVLLLSACGSASQQEFDISTAVAQTVQAGESLTEIANRPTITPEIMTQVPINTEIAPTLIPAPSDPNCASASLVGENPPDGALLKPGEYFWKTWTLRNTGTCAWDASFKLIYWSGDLMGGLSSYALPEVLPNEQKDISIYLKAPETDGTFTGYWRLQTPWNADFGVGETNESFYVQVVVSADTEPGYGITSVAYVVLRDPPTGCPANVRYTVQATITTNGAHQFSYSWIQSDGNNSGAKTMKITEAGSRTISREWIIGKGDSPNPRWMMIVVTEPNAHEYGKAEILNNCS